MTARETIEPLEIKKILDENEEALKKYVSLLIKANETARLTGATDESTLWEAHVKDCAFALPLLPKGAGVIDVGTGGGLPGIVWAVCRPDIRVTMVESIGKKAALAERMARLMGLSNATVECSRSEDYAKKNAEKFDAATARAVCAAGILAEYLSPFVRRGGFLIAFKGPRATEEIAAVGDKWDRLALSSPRIISYDLGEMKRCFVIWDKTRHTPKGFPRRAGAAEKFPWYER